MGYVDGEVKGKFDRQTILKEVARVLNFGGVLGLFDHSATANSGTKDTQTLPLRVPFVF